MASATRRKRGKSTSEEEIEEAVRPKREVAKVQPSGSSEGDDVDDESSASSESSDDAPAAPTLAATRTRRVNAGNRMQALTNDELIQDDAYKSIYGGFTENENDEEFDTSEEENEATDSGDSSISYEQTSSEDQEEAGASTRKADPDDEDDGNRRTRKKKFSELVAASNAKRTALDRKSKHAPASAEKRNSNRRRVASVSSAEVALVKPSQVDDGKPRLDSEHAVSAVANGTLPATVTTVSDDAVDDTKLKEILLETGDALRRSSRSATQLKSIETQERLFEERAARNARPKRVKHKVRPLTQEEHLALAAENEIENTKWLEERGQRLLELEREKKKIRRKAKFVEQGIKFIYRLRLTEVQDDDAEEKAATDADGNAVSTPDKIDVADPTTVASSSAAEQPAEQNKVRTRQRTKNSQSPVQPTLSQPLPTAASPDVIECTLGLQTEIVFPSKAVMDDYFAPFTKAKQPQPPRKCAITGTIARYIDPLTKMPYSDKYALIAIRDAFVAHVRKNFAEDYPDRVKLEEWYKHWRPAHTMPNEKRQGDV